MFFALKVLTMASQPRVEEQDLANVEWLAYINRLRETVLEAYISMMHGLHEIGRIQDFKPSAEAVLGLVKVINDDALVQGAPSETVASNEVLRQACSAIGDLVGFFKNELTE